MTRKTSRNASRASHTSARNGAPPSDAERVERFFTARVTIDRARGDVPMLVLRGEWLKAIGFPIGAMAFLSTDSRGDITLRRLGLAKPRTLRIVKAKR